MNGIPFTDEEPDEEGVSVYEHHRLTADSGQKPMRIDKFLMEHLYNTSRNRLQRAAEQEFILVNGPPDAYESPVYGLWYHNQTILYTSFAELFAFHKKKHRL